VPEISSEPVMPSYPFMNYLPGARFFRGQPSFKKISANAGKQRKPLL
jgi:hypothetical protein